MHEETGAYTLIMPIAQDVPLFIKWVISDVYFTHSFEDSSRLPVYQTI